jgi:hypothetical protein
MKTLSALRDVALRFCPDLEAILFHDSEVTASTWRAGIETGKAIELVSLCSLVSSLRSFGCYVAIPPVFRNNPDLFYLRNVIPRHHGAQAGHDHYSLGNLTLADRFIGAMTPKAVFRHPNGRKFSIFREGHPIHSIRWAYVGKEEYLDRPDIVVSEGCLTSKLSGLNVLQFEYVNSTGVCNGELRIKNDINLPLICLTFSQTFDLPVAALIECSVGKGRDVAREQLSRYMAIFDAPERPVSTLINGRKKACPEFDVDVHVDVADGNEMILAEQLRVGLARLATLLHT